MLFFVILGGLFVASACTALLIKSKKADAKKPLVIKRVAIGMACALFVCISILGVVVLKCQTNITDDSLEMERVYLVYKVDNDECNSSIVKRIEDYNHGIARAKQYRSNPFFGVFYTDAQVRAKPIKYEIKIVQ